MYTVTRQHYYYSGAHAVEITQGGLDYAGADALCAKYPGEFETFSDPREAAETAIAICRAWRADGCKRARLAFGCTHGMGMELEPTTFRDVRKTARRLYDQAPKCDGCREPLGSKTWHANDWDGLEYCSERCAEEAAIFDAEQNREDDEEE